MFWKMCSTHNWEKIHQLFYICSKCYVAGYPQNKRLSRTSTNMTVYKCPICKQGTPIPKVPCPNCYKPYADPERILSLQDKKQIIADLTIDHIHVLQDLMAIRIPQAITTGGGILSHLKQQGFIKPTGQLKPPFKWMITKLGLDIVQTLTEQRRIQINPLSLNVDFEQERSQLYNYFELAHIQNPLNEEPDRDEEQEQERLKTILSKQALLTLQQNPTQARLKKLFYLLLYKKILPIDMEKIFLELEDTTDFVYANSFIEDHAEDLLAKLMDD